MFVGDGVGIGDDVADGVSVGAGVGEVSASFFFFGW